VTLNPLRVTTVTAGFIFPFGIVYDGAHIWVTDVGTNPGRLFKLDADGAIIQTVTTGQTPRVPVFDGANIWVLNSTAGTVTVVRASTGAVLATLSGNGMLDPVTAAIDGERILVTNQGNSVSLWKAADLTPLGFRTTGAGTGPTGACSDGHNFWITLRGSGQLARF
jgi:DNA-binding beta-propeller fold protein YncE